MKKVPPEQMSLFETPPSVPPGRNEPDSARPAYRPLWEPRPPAIAPPRPLAPPAPPTPPPPPPAEPADQSIYERWFAFHKANPHVYKELRKLAMDAAGHRQVFGISAITEVARWERRFGTTGEDYKMPNAFRSMYARLLMEQEVALVDFFNTAVLRTADWPTDLASVRARTASV